MNMATKPKKAGNKVGVFALVDPEQKTALEEMGREQERSVGFLVREAITEYLAKPRKKS
jgi:hypothetical protein